ncbi:MAG TPA: hypothetical protein VFQ77_21300 [Pseudonocardiaceae bacterium]|jgi:hypothetical protein|nr:hypothetical protein [Pseudonocardiaceae bacterium]
MMANGFTVDSDGLCALASQLREGASALDDAANPVPPAPNAGSSSAKAGETLALIVQATAGLIAGVEDIASKIHLSDGSYGATDNQADVDLRRAGGG